MRKGLIMAALLLLAGCSSTIENTYYQLPSGSNMARVESPANGNQPMIWVEQVTVPDFMAGNGLVYQTSDVKYVIAANNLWASPLDQQLQQTLVTNLSKALPGRLVASTPLGDTHDTLTVNVTGFQGRYDGQVVVSGEWLLQHQGRLIKHGFNLTLPQTEDGYDALVRTLAIGWQQTAQQIANSVISLN
ncbi:membrane integrity-associated transporter subunit PqiC [Candidatus Pantoea formicae]|uniref:membrane integrity-associated transporter subunit PqiC n=1 Tax=Candidatus Pantoea formicae TaxID=2608355 RepID=UPI003ED9A9C6